VPRPLPRRDCRAEIPRAADGALVDAHCASGFISWLARLSPFSCS